MWTLPGELGVGLQRFLLLALFGLAAQLIDGALGMAYGLTSTTLLLASGLAPAVASASVHLAEVGTTLASGAAHWKLGNTDWRAVRWLALPGGLGAFAGATVLSNLDGDAARPWISLFLVILGAYVLIRFAFLGGRIRVREGSLRRPLLAPLGLVAGFLDLIGGSIAAPIAAWLVRWLHPRILGAAVGGLIVLTNGRTVLNTIGVEGNPQIGAYVMLIAIWCVAIAVVVRGVRLERRQTAAAMA